MAVSMISRHPALSDAQVDALEQELGVRFPAPYRDFLKNGNVSIPAPNRFKAQKLQSSVVKFLGVSRASGDDLVATAKTYADRLPADVVPVALAGGGNLVCLYLPLGSVYVWDHEEEADADEEPTFDNMHLAATSFAEFLSTLEPFDPASVELDPADVVSVKLKPGFMDKFKNNMR